MITAQDIMTRRLAVTSPSTRVVEAIDLLVSNRVSGLPVIDSAGALVGRFSERSAIAALDLGFLSSGSRVASPLNQLTAGDLLDRTGLALKSDQDVFISGRQLIDHGVSGAPVVDSDGTLRGVFSEQSVMHAFIGLCWEQLPSSDVTAWIDRHDDRRIAETTSLEEILLRFQNTQYRRLMVLRDGRFLGQVTRRDALQAATVTSQEPLAQSQNLRGEGQLGLKTTVEAWMHRDVNQTTPQADVLSIASQFLSTEARQLPVLNDNQLEGQISRSDLLRAVQRFFPQDAVSQGAQPLYLTSLDKHDARTVL